jgi:hypothetical protein
MKTNCKNQLKLLKGHFFDGVSSSSSVEFLDMSICRDFGQRLSFFKGFKTSLNSLVLASRIWQLEEQAALMEEPT